jgi:dihydrofolate synthase/folylpolyglutamate synthase
MTGDEAERYLLSLELFGMHFGLERMRRLMIALDHPEQRFGSIHVVGTNGKSSTTRMIAEILSRHGLRTGAYLSPHLRSFGERIRIDGRDLSDADFGAALTRARQSLERVDRSSAPDDPVTQFEALTAAAYSEMARQDVDVAVVEAGLGGRFDATNVIPSTVTVLTTVGLEHTRWLGPTIIHIATEKLDVVQPGSTLVLGPDLHPDARAVADHVAAQRIATIVVASADPGVTVGAPGAFQRRNFAVARAAAQAYLGALDPAALSAAAAAVRVPGRLQQVGESPTTYLDGAHNADGIRALAQSLPELAAGSSTGRTIAVVSILDDKDPAAMLKTLTEGGVDGFVFTKTSNPRALPPATLASLEAQLHGAGATGSEIVPEPQRALARARELAGSGGVVIATGSIYLIADLLDTDHRRRASML